MHRVMKTKAQKSCLQWKYLSQTWVELKDMKESYPIEIAEYAVKNGFSDEPAFTSWVPYKIKNKKVIINKFK